MKEEACVRVAGMGRPGYNDATTKEADWDCLPVGRGMGAHLSVNPSARLDSGPNQMSGRNPSPEWPRRAAWPSMGQGRGAARGAELESGTPVPPIPH